MRTRIPRDARPSRLASSRMLRFKIAVASSRLCLDCGGDPDARLTIFDAEVVARGTAVAFVPRSTLRYAVFGYASLSPGAAPWELDAVLEDLGGGAPVFRLGLRGRRFESPATCASLSSDDTPTTAHAAVSGEHRLACN
jgi:hypothetical protein